MWCGWNARTMSARSRPWLAPGVREMTGVDGMPRVMAYSPLGTDGLGRDIFARTMKGVQTSLIVMVIIGVVVGAAMGLSRRIDDLLQGWAEITSTLATEAPTGELELEQETVSTDAVRERAPLELPVLIISLEESCQKN